MKKIETLDTPAIALTELFNYENDSPWHVIGTDNPEQQVGVQKASSDINTSVFLNFGHHADPIQQLRDIILPRLRQTGILSDNDFSNEAIIQAVIRELSIKKSDVEIGYQIKFGANTGALIMQISTMMSVEQLTATAKDELFTLKKPDIHYV